MTEAAKPLTFTVVDGIAFAAAAGRLPHTATRFRYLPNRLGPLLELLHLAAGQRVPAATAVDWLAPNGAASMITALSEQREWWTAVDSRRMGFIRAVRSGADGDSHFTAFLMDAQRAANEVARLPGSTPGQLVAAMRELENNIHEHSEAAGTGLLAFRAAAGVFEFVVADRGIGILTSLQLSALYPAISDHGRALQCALTDGVSRFGSGTGRGHGFRPIFVGLANLHGSLRFRSGDHALVVDGTGPSLLTAKTAQKAPLGGFFASISCHASHKR